ncbi:MAG: c-type cytochrome [Roseiflexus sp.]|nr:c-type cytochrome [Roseiflexus sp.]MCS7287985.1 c-type cytochrome [Roseiflexus sp.]MDW8148063.1 c-type cytochrome [Roseiflexaceae bacterium]MDW8234038.1 c-type cytochrome [Roseiflexaceae bacterium]
MKRTYTLTFASLLALVLALSACGGGQGGQVASAPAEPLPRTISANGDPEKGRLYYENEGGCLACHSTGTDKLVGPGLAGVMTTAGPVYPEGVDYGGKLPNGQPRTEENIAAWIRSGGQGKIGVMSPHEISDEDMANLLAYLHTLKRP